MKRTRGSLVAAVVLLVAAGCSTGDVAGPRPQPIIRRTVELGADPLYVAIERISGLCPDVGSRLHQMYSAGHISYQPQLSDPAHSAETTWNYNEVTGQRQPDSERIALGSWLDSPDFKTATDNAHQWLAHEAGHVLYETHPPGPGNNSYTGNTC